MRTLAEVILTIGIIAYFVILGMIIVLSMVLAILGLPFIVMAIKDNAPWWMVLSMVIIWILILIFIDFFKE